MNIAQLKNYINDLPDDMRVEGIALQILDKHLYNTKLLKLNIHESSLELIK